MRTLAESAYLESEFGTPFVLVGAGSALENPYVYDASALELKTMAENGLVRIVDERRSADEAGGLICRLVFERLR